MCKFVPLELAIEVAYLVRDGKLGEDIIEAILEYNAIEFISDDNEKGNN